MNLICCECFVVCYVLPAIKNSWIPVIMCDYKDIWNELNMYICICAYMLISATASILSTSESADFFRRTMYWPNRDLNPQTSDVDIYACFCVCLFVYILIVQLFWFSISFKLCVTVFNFNLLGCPSWADNQYRIDTLLMPIHEAGAEFLWK